MAILIDSSVLITAERQNQSPRAVVAAHQGETAAIAAITAAELLAGVGRANTPERQLRREAFVEGILELLPIVPFDLSVARVYARIVGDLAAQGRRVDTHDAQIAATAIAHGYAILTHNLRDFQRIPGLEVVQAR